MSATTWKRFAGTSRHRRQHFHKTSSNVRAKSISKPIACLQAITIFQHRGAMIIASPVTESSTLTQITSGLTFFDWTIVAVLVTSAIAAFFRGLIRSLFSVAGLIVGIVLVVGHLAYFGGD